MIQSISGVPSLKDELVADFAAYTVPFKDVAPFSSTLFSAFYVKLPVVFKLARFAFQQDCFPAFLSLKRTFTLFKDASNVVHADRLHSRSLVPYTACRIPSIGMDKVDVSLQEVLNPDGLSFTMCKDCQLPLLSLRGERKNILSETAICGFIKLMSFPPFSPSSDAVSISNAVNIVAENFAHYHLGQFSKSTEGAYTSFIKTTALVNNAKETVLNLESFWRTNASLYKVFLETDFLHQCENSTSKFHKNVVSFDAVCVHAVQVLLDVRIPFASFLKQVFGVGFSHPDESDCFPRLSEVSFLLIPAGLFTDEFLNTTFSVHTFGGKMPFYSGPVSNFLETAWSLHASSNLPFKRAVLAAESIFK